MLGYKFPILQYTQHCSNCRVRRYLKTETQQLNAYFIAQVKTRMTHRQPYPEKPAQHTACKKSFPAQHTVCKKSFLITENIAKAWLGIVNCHSIIFSKPQRNLTLQAVANLCQFNNLPLRAFWVVQAWSVDQFNFRMNSTSSNTIDQHWSPLCHGARWLDEG